MNSEIHPLKVVGQIYFETPPLIEFKKLMKQMMDMGDLSLICYGLPRCGKSTLMTRLISLSEAKTSSVVFHAMASGTSGNAKTYVRLARELLDSRGGRPPFSQVSEAEALVKRAEADAAALGVNRVVFFIDEAQELSLEQLFGLKEAMQSLINKGLSPFVIMFAQPEIVARQKMLIKANHISLVDRFYLRMHRLRGLKLEEFEDVLEMYDKTRWPTPGGPTFTEYFQPTLWKVGWRMKSQCNNFVRSFDKIAKEFQIGINDVPIKYLIFAANSLFLTYSKEIELNPSKAFEIIDLAVRNSGIIESYQVLGDINKNVANSGESKGKNKRRDT
jgi:hypothetical protein